ncbi:hypothetical protein [Nonomuraea soli]|uniref:Uncharacterized protein n=1 Tax=Nonomuraea soli TaxID=1032476 RepID=A0A7W0HRR9_9ACTN|nr:hypothetical protein [Nonomuraea soli]MBA2892961.1 hypothetical protein [Nonomuraea soli]
MAEAKVVIRRGDTVLVLDTDDGPYVLIVEAQGCEDKHKPAAWAYYVSYVTAKYDAQPILLVISRDAKTAGWARRFHYIGLPDRPCLIVCPLAIGPDDLPAVTDFDQACSDLVLTVFSALVHAERPEAEAILEVLCIALATIPTDLATELAAFAEAGLRGTTAFDYWSRMMSMRSIDYQTVLEREGVAKGLAKGLAEALLGVLAHNEVEVSDDARARIESCTDPDVLRRWFVEAFDVSTAEELFD